MSQLISVQGLSYSLSDGTPVFNDFNFHFGYEKVGIVGKNGVGKTTLLKLIAKELEPSAGSILINGKVSYLPQKITDFSNQTLSEILKVDQKLFALKKAEQGNATPGDILLIGNDWNSYLRLDRMGHSLSGGEMMRCLLARLFLEKPDLILLDEPTNNLDLDSKSQFYESLKETKAGMLIVSHDRDLLNLMDRIIEISNLGLKYYGGNFDFYLQQRKIEDTASLNKLQSQQEQYLKQKKLEQATKEKQARKTSQGEKRAVKENMSPLEIGARMDQSQKTSARLKQKQENITIQLKENVEKQKENLREQHAIQIDIKSSKIPSRKRMVVCQNLNFKYPNSDHDLWKQPLNLEILGNTRVAIAGKNGSGKTTLIQLITKKILPSSGDIYVGSDHIAVLDQKCSLLEENLSIFENMKRFAPDDMLESDIRIRAGRFLFYGDDVFKTVSVLSGGERLRASLACLLATNNAPDILILDEPTNNLDLDSIVILTESLNQFDGVLIVVSHDQHFLSDLKINEVVHLSI
jgi:ATPase subunit of ABC transporter with duplicated ATPase domains